MVVLHSRNDVLVRTRNGRDQVMCAPLDLLWYPGGDPTAGRRLRVPSQARSDQASTPRLLWSLGLTPFGDHYLGAITHDSGYQQTLQEAVADAPADLRKKAADLRAQAEALLQQADELEAPCWVTTDLKKEECDTLFLDIMTTCLVDEKIKFCMYNGVRLGGQKAFDDDRAAAKTAAQLVS